MTEALTLDALSSPESALGRLLNTMFDGVYIVDRQRRIRFWNRGAEEVTGYPATEVIGRPCADGILNHVDEAGRPICRRSCPLTETFRTGRPVSRKVYPLRKQGGRVPVVTHVAPIRNAADRIIGAVEVFRDVTSEEDLRILQEKFQDLIRQYVSSATLEEVMDRVRSGGAGTSRLRELTVLFLDIVGFTSFSERHPPEEVVTLLNQVFGVCELLSREWHGDIDKFIGDAVMAVFTDANDAVAAAAAILHGGLPRLNAERAQGGREPVAIRIGMSSGNVIQGNVGTTSRKDLTVIGDVVNTAARIQALIPPNCLAISEATLARLRQTSRFVPAGTASAKGKRQPVAVFHYRHPEPIADPTAAR